MYSEINPLNDPDIAEALAMLENIRKHQQERLIHGVNRVYLHYEDVDGDWLERWGEEEDLEFNRSYVPSKTATEFINAFAKALENPASYPLLFSVYGVGGVGKSTLGEKIKLDYQYGDAEYSKHEFRACFASYDFSGKKFVNSTPIVVMENLYYDLPISGDFSNSFGNLYEEYNDTLQQLEYIPIEGKEKVDDSQRNLFKELKYSDTRLASAKLLTTKEATTTNGGGSYFGTSKGRSLALLERTDELLSLASKDSWQEELLLKHRATKDNIKRRRLITDPIATLTKAFAESLIELQIALGKPIVLRFDHYEKASPDLDIWLFEYLLKQEDLQNYPIRILITGRNSLKKKHRRQQDLIFERELGNFNKSETEVYLNKIGITQPNEIKQIYEATKGFPFHLGLLKQQKEEGKDINCSRDNKDLADRLMEDLTADQKKVLQLAAYCRWFDEPMIEYLVTQNGLDFQLDDNCNCFEWLIEQHFVKEEDHFYVNGVVRDILRKIQHKINRNKFQDNHYLLAQYFEQLANEEIAPDRSYPAKYDNSQWCEYKSEQLYHILFAKRDEGQIELLTHFFAGAYLKQMDVVMTAFAAVASEGNLEEHNKLLPSDTKSFIQNIVSALIFGWLVWDQSPERYEFNYEKNQETFSIKPQIEAALSKCLSKVKSLDGLAKYVGLMAKSYRSKLLNEKVNILQQAREQAKNIVTDDDLEFRSHLFFKIGYLLASLERYEEAITSYDECLKIKPDYYQAWNNRGAALGNLERYEEAIASYDEAIKIKPDCDKAWYNRGVALIYLERYEEAIASYDKAIEIKPDFDQAWINRGIALIHLKRYEEAIASFDKALKIKSDDINGLNNRSLLLSLLGRCQEALADLEKALKLEPKNPLLWANKGIILARAGRYEEALLSCDEALKLDPKNESGYYGKACCYALWGDVDLAIENLQQAITIKPRRCRLEAKRNHDFDSIRNDERFLKLLQE